MLFGKLTRPLILPLVLITVLIGQVSRDETIQITYPTTGTVIDTNFVDATFSVADYFDLGIPGCASCDGFIKVSLNGSTVDSIYSSDALVPLTGLSEGAHTLILEAVDPSGNSYSPAATDTSYFNVNMISVDDLCPVWNFSVFAGDARNYLSWSYPSNEPPAEWYFAHDGTFENAYGSFDGGSGTAQLFMPTGYPATIQSVRFHVDDGGSFTQDVEVNVFADDGITLLAGPYIVGGDSGWVEVDVDDAVIEAGGFIVSTYNVSTGGPYISVDSDNSSSSLFFGNATDGWNEMGSSYGIFAEGSHEAFISAPGARATWVNNTYNNMGDNLPLPGASIINADGITVDPIATSNSGNNSLTNIEYPPAIEMVARYAENYNTTIYTRHPNDIPNNDSSRELIPGCGDLTNFSIYLSNGTLVANVDTNSFVHDSLTNGTEYCYYVIANYSGGASTASESICVTPQGFVPSPITNLYGIGLDEEVALDWTSPDVPQLGIPYSEDFDSELLDLWTLEGDNWFISNTAGNPAPSAYFSYTPTQTNFDLSLTSPVLPYSGEVSDTSQDVLLTYDFTLDNWSPTGTEHLAVEYRDGATWNTLRNFANSADYAWDTYTDTIPSPSDNVQVRFRAYGDNSFNIDAFIVDNVSLSSVSGGGSRDFIDGDFIGYNVYIDSSTSSANLSLLDSTGYMVENLSNSQSYNFGVTAKYYPDYESEKVNVTVIPTWMYGDISGTVSDPSGNPLDSAIVSAGGVSDTTGTSGYYSIMGLVPGLTTVTVRRDGFDNDVDEITVLAQEDAVVHNIMLGPKMDKPRGLEAEASDHQVMLMWKSPSGLDEVELYYDDGTWESSITGGSTDIELAVKFTPSSAGELYTARFLFSSEGQTGYDLSPVEVRVYSVGFDGLPATSLYVADEFTDVTVEDQWIDVDLSGEGIIFDDQGFYLGFRFTEAGGPGMGRDLDGYVYGHSYVFLQGQWFETGDLGFSGNFMMRAVAGLENTTREDVQELVTTANVIHENMENVAAIINGNSTGLPAYEISGEQNITFPTQSVRTDSMTGYNVYQVLDGADTLVATTDPGDTTATISVPANYVEYCYAVSSSFQTDSYGLISSKKSNTACAVPFTSGDTDFDSNVSLSDLLSVADYVLEVSVPTEDQFRGADVNDDRFINIQDVVLIVDIIYGSSARKLPSFAESIAEISMRNGGGSSLLLDLAYDGFIRGVQFDLTADLSDVMFGSAMLNELQEGVMINSHTLEDGTTRVLAVNLNGGLVSFSSDGFITIPVTMNTGRGDRVKVGIQDIQLIDQNGESIPVNAKGDGSVALELIPMQYALYQNFPNPFNPVTEIQFDIPDISTVELVVYNLMGQEVRRLVNGEIQAGYHRIVWNGLNAQGEPVSTGVYIYSLTSPSFHSTKKMVLLK
jgi:hypothetical protein